MSSDEHVLCTLTADRDAAPQLLDRLARSLVLQSLGLITSGNLHLVEANQCFSFGDHTAELAATIRVTSPAFYRKVAWGGSIGAGEAYMDGLWSADDLPAIIRIMVRNQDALNRLEGRLAKLAGMGQRLFHLLHDNTRRGSQRNIASHYDLGNDFYQLFLDPTMAYSSGFFTRPDCTMEEASIAKFDQICRKLRLGPGMTVLEIGTGWGGFALHAAREYGCHVTTTTISQQQHAYAAAQIAAAGLSNQISLLLQDYRDLTGQFDRLVSIEMIEAVGHRHLPTFFAVCGQRLKPDGMGLIQAITVPDRAYDNYVKNPDFINRYIFPGGCCPSLAAMTRASAATSDLTLVQLEDLAPHYTRTLQEWRCAFSGHLGDVRALGYDERFIRMWDYYLSYCEGGFAERFTGLLQLVYVKPDCRITPDLPPLEACP